MQLTTLAATPPGLFDCDAATLADSLDGPTLISIAGDLEPALFISVLLHGNETSGWEAVRRILSRGRPRRSIELFIGNVAAAAAGCRALPGQPDYNRIWKDFDGAERHLADALLSRLARRPLLAGVDFHNNTGQNPHYTVLTNLKPQRCGLAWLFSDKAVFVEEPDTVLSRAVDALCPTIAVEVGPIRDARSDARATGLLESLLQLDALPPDPGPALSLYRAIGRVHVEPDIEFAFADAIDAPAPAEPVAPLILTGGLESINFHRVEPGFEFARSDRSGGGGLRVLDPAHRDVTDRWFERSGTAVRLARATVPAMVTTDPVVIRQDCLCYLMEKL